MSRVMMSWVMKIDNANIFLHSFTFVELFELFEFLFGNFFCFNSVHRWKTDQKWYGRAHNCANKIIHSMFPTYLKMLGNISVFLFYCMQHLAHPTHAGCPNKIQYLIQEFSTIFACRPQRAKDIFKICFRVGVGYVEV